MGEFVNVGGSCLAAEPPSGGLLIGNVRRNATKGTEMSKHTPGPWYWEEASENGEVRPVLRTKATINRVCDFGRDAWQDSLCGEPPDAADARLIAAAPEMLEALVDCREALRRAGATGELKVVDDAIAKATGETK